MQQARSQTKTENKVHYLAHALQLEDGDLNRKRSEIKKILVDQGSAEKKIKKQKKAGNAFDVNKIMDQSKTISDIKVVAHMTDANSIDELKDLGDALLNSMKSGVGVLGAEGDKPMIVVIVSNDLIKMGLNAGSIAKSIGASMGGGGGGKPHLATAGGKDLDSLKNASSKSFEIIDDFIKG